MTKMSKTREAALLKLAEDRSALIAKGQPRKVGLKWPEGGSEGPWAVFVGDDELVYEDNASRNVPIYGYLANTPVCGEFGPWGMRVKFRTQGENRPEATIEDQDAEFAKERNELFLAFDVWRKHYQKESA